MSILLFSNNSEKIDSRLLKIDQKSYKNIGVYYIGYITTKSISDYENINSVYPLHLIIGEVDGYIEGNNENKYLTFYPENLFYFISI